MVVKRYFAGRRRVIELGLVGGWDVRNQFIPVRPVAGMGDKVVDGIVEEVRDVHQ